EHPRGGAERAPGARPGPARLRAGGGARRHQRPGGVAAQRPAGEEGLSRHLTGTRGRKRMTEFAQQVAAGFVNGCIYAMLALALVMIYRATNHVNFAQGEMAMFSTYIAWSLLEAGLPYWAAALAAIAFGFVAGTLVERVALRPLHGAPLLSIVTVFVALMIIIQSAAGLVFGHES